MSNVARVVGRAKWTARLFVAGIALVSGCGGSGENTSPVESAEAAMDVPRSHALAVTTPTARRAALDSIVFGNTSSESAHGLRTAFAAPQATVAPIPSSPSVGSPSDVVTNALGLSARRLLPRTPNADYYGGEARFTMAVDPIAQNHFTIKFLGSAWSSSWLVLEVDGHEVGGRHLTGDESILLNHSGWFANRFIYRTVRLPWHLTQGRTSVSIRVRSIGRIAYYSAGYDAYQTRMNGPTVELYGAYTHTTSYLDVTDEPQGTAPAIGNASLPGSDAEAAWMTAWKSKANSQLAWRMAADPASLRASDVNYLAQAYGAAWTSAYKNPVVVTQVIAAFDAMVRDYSAAPDTYLSTKFADSGGNGGWGGYFGPVGDAIRLLWPQVQGRMDTTQEFGGAIGSTTRRAAWATALRASVDFGRFHRKSISNQEIDAARRIHGANAGLLLVDAAQALTEPEARRYLYEAYGIKPYLGNDQPGGGPVPVRGTAPYGPNWFMTTSRGTTKEDCLVGGDYGEQGAGAFLHGVDLDDAALKAQGLKMLRARAALRYPAQDGAGNLTSYAVEQIGCRNDESIGSHVAYLGRGAEDAVRIAALGAGVVGADVLGYVQQQFAEGQLLNQLSSSQNVDIPAAYTAFRAQAQTGVKLPMSAGQPDFAWADEENMVVAARHGDERFWAALNWRGADAMNRLARVYAMSAQTARVAEVTLDDVQYRPAGYTVTRKGSVDNTPPHGYAPPDGPVNANKGLVLPVALRPDLTAVPPFNRDGGRGTGYTLRYGPWLVAINAHPSRNYTMAAPPGFTGGTNLVSGTTYGAAVTLAPKTSAVFYLGSDVPLTQPPTTPLTLEAGAFNHAVQLGWDATPGAASYVIRRATSPDGPYTTIATQVAGTGYVDATANNATTYYYQVVGSSTDGALGASSPTTRVELAPSSLPAPWFDTDIGTFVKPGTTTVSGGSFSIEGTGGGLFGNADAVRYVYAPLSGNGVITARVASQVNSGSQAHAGLDMRESLATNSRHAALVRTPGSLGVDFRFRSFNGDITNHAGGLFGASAPATPGGYWLRLVRNGDVIASYGSADGVTWTAGPPRTFKDLADTIYAGLVVGSSSSTVTGSAAFRDVSLGSLPTPWASSDIGAVGLSGIASATGDVFTVSGSGSDIWAAADSHQFVWQPMTGDGRITARVLTQQDTHPWAKAGVMLRTGLDAGSRQALMAMTPSRGAQFAYRSSDAGWTRDSQARGIKAPYWIRLTRAGSTVTGHVSADGLTWSAVGSATVTLPNTVYVGLAVTAHDETQLSTATFDNVSVDALPSPWLGADIGQSSEPGSAASDAGGVFELTSRGFGLFGNADAVRYAYVPMAGNGIITARVRSQVNSGGSNPSQAHAGVMIRESLDAASRTASMLKTPGTIGVTFRYRTGFGGYTNHNELLGGPLASYWVRLVRNGNVITAYGSPDGTNWTSAGSKSYSGLASTVLAGLVVGSNSTSNTGSATLDMVSVIAAP